MTDRPQSCPYPVIMQPVLEDDLISHWVAQIREYGIQREEPSALRALVAVRAEALRLMQRDFDLGRPYPEVLSLGT